MSLKKHFPEFGAAKAQVDPSEIAMYQQYFVFSPSIDAAYIGTATGTATTAQALIFANAYPDYPRTLVYAVTGVAGGQGGTWVLSGQDQFGGTVTETVAIATANGGGTVVGTAIFAKVGGGTFTPLGLGGTAVGTAKVGFGTTVGAQGNWFGLPTRIAGTGDVKTLVWGSSNVSTTLNAGTAIGTLISPQGGTTPASAFQGTANVTATDRYFVTYKSTWDNSSQNLPMAGL